MCASSVGGELRALRCALGAASACAALVPWLVASASASPNASGVSVYESVSTGTLAPSPATSLGPLSTVRLHHRGPRRIPRQPALPQRLGAEALAAPGEPSHAGAPPAANFDGIGSRDSAALNFGEQIEPPDQGLCVGNGFVVEMVNSAYAVYRPDGSILSGPFNVNGPFSLGPAEYTSDPRCYYDATTHTWFATTLFINAEETESAFELAVNPSGDPTTPWTDYRVSTTDIGGSTGPKHPGCPCEGDQPTLGIDQHNVYVTTNEYPMNQEEEHGAQIYAIAKKDLVSLGLRVHFVHFDTLSIGGSPASSVQPALSRGTSQAEYFLSSLDSTATSADRLGVWALTRAAAVGRGAVPTLSSVVLASETYGVPPDAEQRGSRSLLESGDDRMQQVQFSAGSVWGELGTAVSTRGDATQRAGAAWFHLEPALAGHTLAGARILRQGYVALPGEYLLYPALQATPSGAAAMVATASGRALFPGAAYAVLAPGAASFGAVTLAAPGSGHYARSGKRWGDYSWAIADPAGTSVWLATEYVPPASSQTLNHRNNWGTRVLEVPTG